jgi:hypothetical protein
MEQKTNLVGKIANGIKGGIKNACDAMDKRIKRSKGDYAGMTLSEIRSYFEPDYYVCGSTQGSPRSIPMWETKSIDNLIKVGIANENIPPLDIARIVQTHNEPNKEIAIKILCGIAKNKGDKALSEDDIKSVFGLGELNSVGLLRMYDGTYEEIAAQFPKWKERELNAKLAFYYSERNEEWIGSNFEHYVSIKGAEPRRYSTYYRYDCDTPDEEINAFRDKNVYAPLTEPPFVIARKGDCSFMHRQKGLSIPEADIERQR